jgi:hypothetical protein
MNVYEELVKLSMRLNQPIWCAVQQRPASTRIFKVFQGAYLVDYPDVLIKKETK